MSTASVPLLVSIMLDSSEGFIFWEHPGELSRVSLRSVSPQEFDGDPEGLSQACGGTCKQTLLLDLKPPEFDPRHASAASRASQEDLKLAPRFPGLILRTSAVKEQKKPDCGFLNGSRPC